MSLLTQIKRAEALIQYPSLPHYKSRSDIFLFPQTYRVDTLVLPSKSARGHATLLSNALAKFVLQMATSELIFLGCHAAPWLSQEAKHKAAIKAVQYLQANQINSRFNGAIKLYLPEQKEFIIHLFWLTRCHFSFPDIYFMDIQQRFVGNICRYGNVHLNLTDPTHEHQYLQAIQAAGFNFLEQFPCTERFGANKMRQLIL